MLETGSVDVDSSTESGVAPFVARYESECERTRHLFSFLLLLRWFGFQVRLCVHRLRFFRGFRLRGSRLGGRDFCLVDMGIRPKKIPGDEGRSNSVFFSQIGGSVTGAIPSVSDLPPAFSFDFLATSAVIDRAGAASFL